MKYRPIYVRVPEPLYECLRREVYEKHTSQAEIVTEELAERYGLKTGEDEGEVPDGTRI